MQIINTLYQVLNFVRLRYAIIIACTLFFYVPVRAQYFDTDNSKRVYIPFKLVRNLVVIQLKINNKGPFNFILDSGVGIMLITEPSLADSINLESKRTIKMSGLGEGEDFEALVTPVLKVSIPGLVSHDVAAAILKKDHFSLSSYAGMPIHGLLGYEFFNALAVKINFSDSIITVARPKDMRYFKSGTKIPMHIENKKPYINTYVTFANGTVRSCKLMIDLGAGHNVWFENLIQKNVLQQKIISTDLGVGIKGLIAGELSRVKRLELGNYYLKDIIAAFPETDTHLLDVPRDGSLGIGLLKKFNIIFDYPNSMLYLRAGDNYKTRTEHDMSGLNYYTAGNDYNHIIIYKIEPGSPADYIGLEKDDEIVSINLRPVAQMNIQQVDDVLKSGDHKVVLLLIFRKGKYYRIPITLRRRI